MAQSTLSTATLLLATLATHPCHGQAPTHPVKIGDIVHNILFPQSELIGTIHQTHISFLQGVPRHWAHFVFCYFVSFYSTKIQKFGKC